MLDDRQIVCPHCDAINRVPAERSASAANCGVCKQPLFVAAPVDVDQEGFKRQTARNTIPVLIDVWAPWCGPCRMMAPAFAQASRTLEPDMRLLKMNSQDQPKIVASLGIRGIPTLLLFENGKEVARISGAMNAAGIVSWARAQIGRPK